MKKSICFDKKLRIGLFRRKSMEQNNPSQARRCRVLGISYFSGTAEEAVALAHARMTSKNGFSVFTPGATVAAQAMRDARLLALFNAADLLLPDGKGVSLAAHLAGSGRLSQIAGIDFAEQLFSSLAPRETRVFFYGAAANVAERAAAQMREKYPHLIIAAADGYGEDPLARIVAFRPHVTCVCLGAGRQEAWIAEHKAHVGGICIGLGGSFDVWAGDKARAPHLLRRLGLEWLWRTVREPKRISRLLPLPRYFFRCLKVRQNAKKRSKKKDAL